MSLTQRQQVKMEVIVTAFQALSVAIQPTSRYKLSKNSETNLVGVIGFWRTDAWSQNPLLDAGFDPYLELVIEKGNERILGNLTFEMRITTLIDIGIGAC